MAAATINARHRKAFKAGNWTRRGCNTFRQLFGAHPTRSRRRWLDHVELEDAIDREAIEKKQTEARKRKTAALQLQCQKLEASSAKAGLFSRAFAFLRRMAKAA